jgi:hypothetical protein
MERSFVRFKVSRAREGRRLGDFTRVDRHVALLPSDSVELILADSKTLWQVSEARLALDAVEGVLREILGREDADYLHVLMAVIKFVDVVKDPDAGHVAPI